MCPPSRPHTGPASWALVRGCLTGGAEPRPPWKEMEGTVVGWTCPSLLGSGRRQRFMPGGGVPDHLTLAVGTVASPFPRHPAMVCVTSGQSSPLTPKPRCSSSSLHGSLSPGDPRPERRPLAPGPVSGDSGHLSGRLHPVPCLQTLSKNPVRQAFGTSQIPLCSHTGPLRPALLPWLLAGPLSSAHPHDLISLFLPPIGVGGPPELRLLSGPPSWWESTFHSSFQGSSQG